MNGIRQKIFDFALSLFRPTTEFKMPLILRLLHILLFPIRSLVLRGTKEFNYDPVTMTFTLFGMRYSEWLFRGWSKVGVPINTLIVLLSRGDKTIMLGRVTSLSEAEKFLPVSEATTSYEPMPCPFCGAHPSHVAKAPGSGFRVECDSCDAIGPTMRTERGSIRRWNQARRPAPIDGPRSVVAMPLSADRRKV